MSKQFYIYVQCRPNGDPFYVGKGYGRRAFLFKSTNTTRYQRVIAKYGRENLRVFIRHCESEQEAYEHEVWLIAYGRSQGWRLANVSDGGEGSRGHTHSHTPEARKKISESLIGNKRTSGHTHSVETKEKISLAATGRIVSAETRAKISSSNLGRVISASWRANISAGQRGRIASDETREKMSATHNRLWADPLYRHRRDVAKKETTQC